MSPLVVVREEGGAYERVGLGEWLRFVFHRPASFLGPRGRQQKCAAGIVLPGGWRLPRTLVLFDFILLRRLISWRVPPIRVVSPFHA